MATTEAVVVKLALVVESEVELFSDFGIKAVVKPAFATTEEKGTETMTDGVDVKSSLIPISEVTFKEELLKNSGYVVSVVFIVFIGVVIVEVVFITETEPVDKAASTRPKVPNVQWP